jgi:hypothetical protein
MPAAPSRGRFYFQKGEPREDENAIGKEQKASLCGKTRNPALCVSIADHTAFGFTHAASHYHGSAIFSL